MTATNMCSNFGSFMYSPPLSSNQHDSIDLSSNQHDSMDLSSNQHDSIDLSSNQRDSIDLSSNQHDKGGGTNPFSSEICKKKCTCHNFFPLLCK